MKILWKFTNFTKFLRNFFPKNLNLRKFYIAERKILRNFLRNFYENENLTKFLIYSKFLFDSSKIYIFKKNMENIFFWKIFDDFVKFDKI